MVDAGAGEWAADILSELSKISQSTSQPSRVSNGTDDPTIPSQRDGLRVSPSIRDTIDGFSRDRDARTSFTVHTTERGRLRPQQLLRRDPRTESTALSHVQPETVHHNDARSQHTVQSAADSEDFRHTALGDPQSEIRLLKILPATQDDPIRLEVSTHKLNAAPDFIALSYVWGESRDVDTVWIGDKRCSVRHNCFYALWQARLHYAGSLIWIDSISINQQDMGEKGAQVTMMGNIFNAADFVLVCVGPPSDNSEMFAQLNIPAVGFEQRNDEVYQSWILRQPQHRVLQFCTAFQALASRRYWNRIWILQEINLAKRLVMLCGHDKFPWSTVRFLAKVDHQLRSPSWEHDIYELKRKRKQLRQIPKLEYMRVTGGMQLHSRDLPGLLNYIVHRDCSDIRDRIYGVASLVNWTADGLPDLRPDYNLSPFRLAVKVVCYARLQSFGEVLTALRINERSPEVEELRRQRQSNIQFTVTAAESEHNIPNVRCRTKQTRFCKLEVHGGQLTAALTPDSPGVYYHDESLRELGTLCESPTENLTARKAQKLCNVEGAMAGLITEEAQAGDFLIPMDGCDRRKNIFIVARATGKDTYDIIGQAFTLRNRMCAPFKDGYNPCACAIGPHDFLQADFITMSITGEDAVALVAHDFTSSTTFNAVKRLERPSTRVCGNPADAAGAITIKNIRRLNRIAAKQGVGADETHQYPWARSIAGRSG